jgi:hypothetical protein
MLVNATSSAWRNAVKRRCLEGRENKASAVIVVHRFYFLRTKVYIGNVTGYASAVRQQDQQRRLLNCLPLFLVTYQQRQERQKLKIMMISFYNSASATLALIAQRGHIA